MAVDDKTVLGGLVGRAADDDKVFLARIVSDGQGGAAHALYKLVQKLGGLLIDGIILDNGNRGTSLAVFHYLQLC